MSFSKTLSQFFFSDLKYFGLQKAIVMETNSRHHWCVRRVIHAARSIAVCSLGHNKEFGLNQVLFIAQIGNIAESFIVQQLIWKNLDLFLHPGC